MRLSSRGCGSWAWRQVELVVGANLSCENKEVVENPTGKVEDIRQK